MPAERHDEIALLCNPRAGGRWRVLAEVLDSDEAKGVRRIVTDDIEDVRAAIHGLGKRVGLLCIYGGDGTIYHVINELLREASATLPRLALLGGGTMNVTASWCGMRRSPGDNFREVMRAYRADRLLWREVPVLAVSQKGQTRHGFTFGAGPLIRLLERYEKTGEKTRLKAVALGVKAIFGALSGYGRDLAPILGELEAQLTVDGVRLPYDRWAAVFANVTGAINPLIEPFTDERTRETFHFLAYGVSTREFAMMVPLLARGLLPIDSRALLHPISAWRNAAMALSGKGLPTDPRYVNHAARELTIETAEPSYTLDGEVLSSLDRQMEVRLGPTLHLATLRARFPRPGPGA